MPTPLPWDEVNMLGSKKLESIESNESLDTAWLNNFIYQSTNFHVLRFPWIYLMLSKYVNHKRVLKDIHKQLLSTAERGNNRCDPHPMKNARNHHSLSWNMPIIIIIITNFSYLSPTYLSYFIPLGSTKWLVTHIAPEETKNFCFYFFLRKPRNGRRFYFFEK